MKTNNKINKKILLLTLKIRSDYPELQFFLNEMPITTPDVKSPKIDNTTLKGYYNSLENLVQKYESNINNHKKTSL